MSSSPPSHDQAAIKALAQAQFAPSAQAYVSSPTHAHGADLGRILALAAPSGTELVLDVATGGGHAALALAPHVRHVIAIDLTMAMLHAARSHLISRGMEHVTYLRAEAEQLPITPGSLDLVICRIAAHHFADVAAFVQRAAATLRVGGRLIVSDHIGLEDPELDQFMDRFERWRDPSHVRAYTFAEWRHFCAQAGLEVIHEEHDPREPYEFAAWTERMRMPVEAREALECWLLEAAPHLRERFAIVEQAGRVLSLRSTFGIFVARRT